MNQALGPDLPGMTCLGKLGAGGFADVFLYERHHPRIRVAVKLMRSADLTDAQRAQFAAEAEVMAELAEHPFIVPVHGAGQTPDGRPYLVMQHYPNADLAARVRKQPLTVAEALRLGIQMASAVETAHRAGIIHRDIKPSNILLTQYRVPGLADFGIAGRPDDAGEIGVSLPWSPPEVLTGASNGSATSDVYSLAATIWTLLVGHSPFAERGNNSDRAIVARILHNPPPSTGRPDVPPALDRLLQQSMAKDPAYRPASALALAQHFQRIEQDLRLARTEVQVLDREAGPTGGFPAVPAVPGEGPDTGSGRSNLTQPGHDLRPRPTYDLVDPESLKPTEFKPPTQIIAQPSFPSSGAHSGAQPAEPTRYSIPSADLPEQVSPSSAARSRRTYGIIALLVLVVVAVVVGIVISRGGSHPHRHTPPPPVDTDLPGVSGPVAPTKVTGHLAGHRATFTWAPVTGATAYQWVADNGANGTTGKPTVVVPMKKAKRLCIQVRTLAGSSGSQGATSACVTR